MTTTLIKSRHLDPELLTLIENAGSANSGKLETHFYPIEATTDGQTVFTIPLETFDANNDTVFVIDGQGMLMPNIGYTLSGKTVTMTEGWALGDGGGIIVLRNAIMNPEDIPISGAVLEDGSVPFAKLEKIPATQEYVQEQIAGVTADGIPKLVVIPLDLIVATEGQTEFKIDLDTYDMSTDTVLVQKGQMWLNPNGDYSISEGNVVLSEGVPAGTTIGIWVFKNVPMGDEGSVSGAVILDGSIPASALAEEYLPLDGSKAMTGNSLKIANGVTELKTFEQPTFNMTRMYSKWDDTIATSLDLVGGNAGEIESTSLMLRQWHSDGTDDKYRIYGEHNKPTPEDIGALDKLVKYHGQDDVIDTCIEGTFLIAGANSKGCPIDANFIYVMQLFYDDPSPTANRIQIAFPYTTPKTGACAIRLYHNDVWSDWQALLSQSGYNHMTGDLFINKPARVANQPNSYTSIETWGNGVDGNTGSGFYDVADANSYDGVVLSQLTPDETDIRYLLKLRVKNNNHNANHHIFGEHNKPSGSYTGNGSATERLIDIGGIGDVLYLESVNGSVFITPKGAFAKDTLSDTVIGHPSSSVYFSAGVLHITTDAILINYVNTTYNYQVL